MKKTFLFSKHIELNAKMVNFSDWEMPIQYTSIIEEHIHVREKVGIFDVCHMGEFILEGINVIQDLEKLMTCNIKNLEIGKCRYGLLLNLNGTIIDDLIVFRLEKNKFMLVVNAATTNKDKDWIKKNISNNTTFIDKSCDIAKLDIQGPLSNNILSNFIDKNVLETIKRFSFISIKLNDIDVLLSRTGYTGELGYELFVDKKDVIELWDIFLNFKQIKPIGLGARDILRLEMGYSLYGNDINETYTPVQANLLKFVNMDKDFIGKQALLEQNNVNEILTGFICTSRRSARKGFKVFDKNKTKDIGIVTSGSFSPKLKKGIGLCYIEKEYLQKDEKVIMSNDVVNIEANIKSLPIYNKE